MKDIITEEEQIEQILEEANAYNLRQEVITTSEMFLIDDPELDRVVAYEMGFMEWVKQMYENCIGVINNWCSIFDRNYRYKYNSTNTLAVGRVYPR